jgi:hypothetical protein
MTALEQAQHRAGAGDHTGGQPREPPDLDPVRAVGAARCVSS